MEQYCEPHNHPTSLAHGLAQFPDHSRKIWNRNRTQWSLWAEEAEVSVQHEVSERFKAGHQGTGKHGQNRENFSDFCAQGCVCRERRLKANQKEATGTEIVMIKQWSRTLEFWPTQRKNYLINILLTHLAKAAESKDYALE